MPIEYVVWGLSIVIRKTVKLARIGREYGIVPNRLLLVQNYLTTEQMETVEYFCEYYCANLEQDNLEHKLITMLENDL